MVEQVGPQVEVEYVVRATARVTAKVEAVTRVSQEAVAEFHDLPPWEVTAEHVQSYVVEDENAVDESMFDLEDIEAWDEVRARVISQRRVQVTPTGWVPLVPDDHTHSTSTRQHACAAGRCDLDDRIEPEA